MNLNTTRGVGVKYKRDDDPRGGKKVDGVLLLSFYLDIGVLSHLDVELDRRIQLYSGEVITGILD